tara:strand:+ start:157 stop:585 length:429 start_codon:yes stop_codon:yes gene_type:complete
MKFRRRGSQAVEFALIFPVFVMFVFGGIDYFWYLLQRYELSDAVATGCRTGAIAGESPYVDAVGIAGATIVDNIGNMGDCGVGVCTIFVDDLPGPTDDVWLLECSAEIAYLPLTGIIPMPELLTAKSIQPVEFLEPEDTAAP